MHLYCYQNRSKLRKIPRVSSWRKICVARHVYDCFRTVLDKTNGISNYILQCKCQRCPDRGSNIPRVFWVPFEARCIHRSGYIFSRAGQTSSEAHGHLLVGALGTLLPQPPDIHYIDFIRDVSLLIYDTLRKFGWSYRPTKIYTLERAWLQSSLWPHLIPYDSQIYSRVPNSGYKQVRRWYHPLFSNYTTNQDT